MEILKKHESGWYILTIEVARFRFSWLTDCGEWFVYFHWCGKYKNRVIRLSSAGCYNETW
jgi:hypothetical protein